MRFSWFTVTLALLLTCGLVRCQDDEEFDLDNDVEVEDEPEQEVPKEKVIVQYTPPQAKGPTHFHEAFLEESALGKRWVQSSAKKDGVEADLAKYDGKWAIEEPTDQPLQGDLGLVLKSKAKHHAVSALLDQPFNFEAEPFIVQYEVKFQNGMECGGAYIKLLSKTPDLQLKNVQDKTPYTIMFGPDKCGNDHKLHFIFRHKNPVTGAFEEKHSKKPSGNFNRVFSDKKTHLFTLVVHPDNNFEIFIDQTSVSSGNLLEDMTPPINPPEEIDDPNEEKPEEWDDRKKIPDPDATKPDDWDEDAPATIVDEDAVMPDGWLEDEPELIDDPNAEKPEDWDEEMDGEWEAPKIKNPSCLDVGCGNWEKPTIPNPEYKGKWKRLMIDNANYKGEWKPQRISNPDYFEDIEPFHMTTIGAVALELWSMTDGILFDNFIITSSRDVADEWAADTWALKLKQEGVSGSAESVVSGLMTAATDRPWLWAIYALVLIIPLFVCFKLCFRKSPPVADDAKKSDAATPDDETKKEEEGAEEGEEDGAEPGAEEGAEPGAKEGAEPGAKEGAEPGAKEGAEPGAEEGEDESSVRQRKKATKADLEQSADADEAQADSNEGAGDTVRKSPRKGKGKTRKE